MTTRPVHYRAQEAPVPEYPVYEKNGVTQVAATPQRQVQLEFDGWRKKESKPAASSDDTRSSTPKSSK